MPLVALGIAAGVAGGAATAYGAHKQGQAAEAANATTSAANKATIAEAQRQDAQAKAQWDARQAQLAPMRSAGNTALGNLGDLLGTHFDTSIPQTVPYSGATPAGPTPGTTAAPGSAGASKAAALTPDLVQAAAQGLNPQDPASLPALVKRLTAQGYDASVMLNNGAPSDHKVWVNGQPWTFVSSQGYQPGTYKWDPYAQGGTAPSWNAQGMPTGGANSGTPTSAPKALQNVAPLAPGVGGQGTTSTAYALPMTGQQPGQSYDPLAPSYAPVIPFRSLYRPQGQA